MAAELGRRLTTTATGQVVFQKLGWESPSGGVGIQTVQSSGLINLNAFRNDPRFAGIDGSGFSVVIIDTGIDLNHPFFGTDADHNGISDRIVFSYDFSGSNDPDASDFDGHGSNVASIAASSDSTYRGMAPGANIIALKVFPDGGDSAYDSDIEEALQWVVNNAAAYNVAAVNLSLGSGNYGYIMDDGSPFNDEFAALAQMNVIAVVAAGNSFYPSSAQGVGDPANDPNVIAVGAVYDANIGRVDYYSGAIAYTTAPDRICPFSQRHQYLLHVLAPGAAITGANATGGTVTMHGTSQAAPHITGIVALMQQLAVRELGRRLTLDEMRTLLARTGVSINDGDDEDDNVTNTGLSWPRVDVLALGNAVMNMKPAAVSGRVFADLNGDGNGSGDPPLAGWTVYIDANNNSAVDAGTATYNSSDVPKSIPNVSMIRSALTISPGPGPITDVNVRLNISHNNDADLSAYLISPYGTRVMLFSDVGGSGNNFNNTTLDDQAATAITSGSAPFSGTYRPESPLSVLNGQNPAGTWWLEVQDDRSPTTGTLNSWSLIISTAEPTRVSQADGTYSFANLPAGSYILREVLQSGYVQTAPPGGYYSPNLSPGQTLADLDFGNSSSPSASPATPVLLPESDTGASSADRITMLNNSSAGAVLRFSVGGTVPSATVALYADGMFIGSAVAGGSSVTIVTDGLPEHTLADGVRQITAVQTEPGKLPSPPSPPLAITVDSAAPWASVPDLNSSSDTGPLDDDDITQGLSPGFGGTAGDTGSGIWKVRVFSDDGADGWDTQSPFYSVVLPTLEQGARAVRATVYDVAGNAFTTAALNVVVDRTQPSCTTPDLDASTDTGRSDSDNITSADVLLFTGSASDNLAGVWKVVLTSDDMASAADETPPYYQIWLAGVSEGMRVIAATVYDLAGNSWTSPALAVHVDRTAPTGSVPDLAAASDTGVSDTDDITRGVNATFSGSASDGGSGLWKVIVHTDDNATAVCDEAPFYSVTFASLNEGVRHVAATVYDVAGNAFTTAELAVVVDRTPPAASVPDLLPAADTGAFDNDDITQGVDPLLAGTAEDATGIWKVVVSSDDGKSATVFGAASWQAILATLDEGPRVISATVWDLAGNSFTTAAVGVLVDRTAPTASIPDLAAASDTGVRSDDNVTQGISPLFTGAADDDRAGVWRVVVFADDGASAVVGSPPFYNAVLPTLSEGIRAVRATAYDLAGNSFTTAPLAVTVDRTAPAAPPAPDLLPASDTGISDSDDITADDTPALAMFAAPFYRVYIDERIASGDYESAATWLPSAPLTPGLHSITVRAVDAAGNESAPGDPLTVLIDTAAPAVTIVPVWPDPRGEPVEEIAIVFTEPVWQFDLDDLSLARDGQIIPWQPPATALSSNDGTAWKLSGLEVLTALAGTYGLHVAPGGVMDRAGNTLSAGGDIAWVMNAIIGTDSPDIIRIAAAAGHSGVLAITVNSQPAYTVDASNIGTLSVTGRSGDDVLILDAAGGNPLPPAGIAFSAGEGDDVLVFATTSQSDALALSAGSAVFNSMPVNWTDLESVRIGESPTEPIFIGALTLSGTRLGLAPGTAPLWTAALALDDYATLDLGDRPMLIRPSPGTAPEVLDAVWQRVSSARNAAPLWSGPGIGSSSLSAGSNMGLAVLLNRDSYGGPLITDFDGLPAELDDVLVKLALNGDVNLDGLIDAADYFRLDQAFLNQPSPARWQQGNFDYRGGIDADDYLLIDEAFLAQYSKYRTGNVSLSDGSAANASRDHGAYQIVAGDPTSIVGMPPLLSGPCQIRPCGVVSSNNADEHTTADLLRQEQTDEIRALLI